MCGIAGFTGSRQPDLLRRMTGSLHYRGPDADGFFEGKGINLGHRRLSIIDLTTGTQPMFSADKNLAIIFNGEIYNFQELRSLVPDYPFQTSSDTEVIMALYRKYGPDGLSRMNGMFAFALWDTSADRLLLARDRMGKKPLYYAEHKGNLYFASEPKALLFALHTREMDQAAASLFFELQFIPGRQSIYRGVFRLLPGEYAVWERGKLVTTRYWNLRFDGSSEPSTDRLGTLLADATKLRLISDVPLGIFLSGGIDSSTVAYYAVQAATKRIKTFSIGFTDPSFDESKYFNAVAKRLGTEHSHHLFTERELLDVIPLIFDRLDEPLADASILPTYLLSRFTREKVTVALGGDGADELFAGYPTFIAHTLAGRYASVPGFARTWAEKIVRTIPVSHRNISFDFKLKQFIKGASLSGTARDRAWTAAFAPEELQHLLSHDVFQSVSEERERIAAESLTNSADSDETAVLRFWQQGYLVDDILTKVDRAAMYSSLEVRAPFLDHRIVEYVNNLPYTWKLRHRVTKFLLKELMRGKLPDEIIDRPKKGFGIPIASWLTKELKEYMLEVLRPRAVSAAGLQSVYVSRLIDEHLTHRSDNRMKLWSLIVFMEWHRRWLRARI